MYSTLMSLATKLRIRQSMAKAKKLNWPMTASVLTRRKAVLLVGLRPQTGVNAWRSARVKANMMAKLPSAGNTVYSCILLKALAGSFYLVDYALWANPTYICRVAM
jgi:hypothetical protein